MGTLTYPYITIDVRGNIGEQLFQLAHVINFLRNSKKAGVKRKLVLCDGSSDSSDISDSSDSVRMYWNTMFKGLFKVLKRDVYNSLIFYKIKADEDESNYFGNAIKDLELNTINCQTFNTIDEKLREKLINIVYNNEDIMYPAYYKYRDALDFFDKDTTDDDMVSLHITKDCDYEDEEYYREALKIAGKINVAIFTDEIDWYKIGDIVERLKVNSEKYKFYYVPKSDVCGDEIDFVLMSMFKNNIIANSTYSLWASYISYYTDKIIIAPQKLACINKGIIHKYISHIV
jgi:hypothetical protein